MQNCEHCNDQGFIFRPPHVFEDKEVTETIDCTAKGCVQGMFTLSHKECGGKGCEDCSSSVRHGIAGRVLCRFCDGEGCPVCEDTGLLRHVCNVCRGSGKMSVTYRPYRKQQPYLPCVHCEVSRVKRKRARRRTGMEQALAKASELKK
jgi:hypothetical protein